MTRHFADRLREHCRAKGAPVCVGIDPVYERLPQALRGTPLGAEHILPRVEAISRFVQAVLETVAPHAPCVKFQSACFERYLWPGVQAYHQLIQAAHKLGLIVISDAKRGDIGISSEHYAAGCLADHRAAELGECLGPDALTVNAYLGGDGLEPFLRQAEVEGKGLFALVRTSNPGGDAIQGLRLSDGRSVAEAVAQVVADLGKRPEWIGQGGYSLLGAVVGATKPQDVQCLRELMPQQIFLVPGFGAQGGKVEDVRACFHADGNGAIITASRSVLFAYEKTRTVDWRGAIEQAAADFNRQIAAVLS